MNTWLGVGFIALIIIAVIVTIVVLNRGNKLDIINTLPNYKIYYPKGKAYVQLQNIDPGVTIHTILLPPTQCINCPNPFWAPRVVVNNSDSFNKWVFETVPATSFDAPNTKIVKMVNLIYNQTGIGYLPPVSPTGPTPTVPSTVGYIVRTGTTVGSGSVYTPNGSPTISDTFEYITTGENLFQLKLTGTNEYIFVENGYFLSKIITDPAQAATFQLVLS
jgi:hypothetical protein